MRKNILFITSSRAEFGLLYQVIKEAKARKNINTKLIVSGTHLDEKFGLSISEIKDANLKIDYEIDIDMKNNNDDISIINSISKGISKFGEVLKKINPSLIIILGDRYEMISVAVCASILKIPIAHINGGETTEGAYDEYFRHSITKMSHLHFVACEEYRRRVIQLGENPNFVFNVGGLGVDSINSYKFMSKKELENDLNFKFSDKNVLVTYHPETMSSQAIDFSLKQILDALETLKNTKIIFTMPNADTGNDVIFKMIKDFVKNNNNSIAFPSLGQLRYFSIVRIVDAVIGNSSSGIAEVPSLKTPTLNIGNRQKGRAMASSIINCSHNKNEILDSLEIIYSRSFQEKLKNVQNPYGNGGSAKKIVDIIYKHDLDKILKKRFFNLHTKI